jgi:hypothetical protein
LFLFIAAVAFCFHSISILSHLHVQSDAKHSLESECLLCTAIHTSSSADTPKFDSIQSNTIKHLAKFKYDSSLFLEFENENEFARGPPPSGISYFSLN